MADKIGRLQKINGELLAALKDGLHALKMDASHRTEIEVLEAAIAKATGEQP